MRGRYVWLTIAAVVLMVAALALASCGGETTTTTAAPTATTAGPTTTAAGPTTTAAGGSTDVAALYAQYCGLSSCHPTVPQDSLESVKAAIEAGKGSEMPAFADKLTAEQIAALAAWVANGGK